VALFTDIAPGTDGQMVLTISFDGTDTQSRGRYASALMLALMPDTCTGDFDYDRDVDGSDLGKIALGQKTLSAEFATNFGKNVCSIGS
jgi:hypothetical protein